MPHNYSQLPVSVPSLFKTIVSRVSAALLDELDNEVYFLHGSYNHIRQRILAKNQPEGFKEAKYPLVALLHSFEEQVAAKTDKFTVKLNLLICTESSNQKHAEDRYTDNYLPILYPIYAELIEQIKRSGFFSTYGTPPHTKVDDLHMGEESGQGGAYTLPDVVDGLWVKDLELTIIPNKCVLSNAMAAPSQLLFLNYISSVNVSFSGSDITIVYDSPGLTDVDSVISNLYYLLHKGDGGGSIDITADQGEDYTFSVSSFPDGEYIGFIEAQDGVTLGGKLCFWYEVLGGKVIAAMSNELQVSDIVTDANIEGFTVSSDLAATDYKITAFDYTDISGDAYYTHDVLGSVSELSGVSYEFKTGRGSSYETFRQKIRVSNKTLISQIIFKIN